MTDRLRCTVLLVAALLLTALLLAGPLHAADLLSHENQDFQFRFEYPASWQLSPVTGGDLRALAAAPDGGPTAQCSVLVKRYPNAATATQEDIDQVFLAPPTATEIKEMLGEEVPDLEVLTATTATLHNRPAHQAALRYPVATLTGTLSAYGRVVMTATPGFTWTISCSGRGATPNEAEKNFAFWGQEIDALISSFRFNQPALPPAATSSTPDTKKGA
ncbi:MAG: hypothetical protein RBT36_02195 [Desulfobulbus sp.]|jgi:hypothetical protein|nr:hypothetical protein [Desulfobulbus sp.]